MTKVYITPASGNAASVAGLSIPAEGGAFELNESQEMHFLHDTNFVVTEKKPVAEAKAAEAKPKAADAAKK